MEDALGAGVVLGRAGAATGEDPFGDGDPVEVARLVRRALAAAGRRALDVTALAVVAEVEPGPVRLARFTRRALGPHGAEVPVTWRAAGPRVAHDVRLGSAVRAAAALLPGRDRVGIAVALGPGAVATALCVALAPGSPLPAGH